MAKINTKFVVASVMAGLLAAVGFIITIPSAAGTNCTAPVVTIKVGSYGACVGYAQTMLNNIGLWHHYSGYSKLVVDKDFGSLTRGQVVAYQKATWGLDVDGIIGKYTWTALCKDAYALAVHRYDLSYHMNAYYAGASAGCRNIVSYY